MRFAENRLRALPSRTDPFSLKEATSVADCFGFRHFSATGAASYISILKN
jgi:hypothetical protein